MRRTKAYCCLVRRNKASCLLLDPVRTAVPFWGQNTRKFSGFSPKRDRSSERLNLQGLHGENLVLKHDDYSCGHRLMGEYSNYVSQLHCRSRAAWGAAWSYPCLPGGYADRRRLRTSKVLLAWSASRRLEGVTERASEKGVGAHLYRSMRHGLRAQRVLPTQKLLILSLQRYWVISSQCLQGASSVKNNNLNVMQVRTRYCLETSTATKTKETHRQVCGRPWRRPTIEVHPNLF